jgi:hypothetical protein
VHDRLSAGEVELQRLTADIARLTIEVKLGGDKWREAVDTLSACTERRRALVAQVDSLRWVLVGDSAYSAG